MTTQQKISFKSKLKHFSEALIQQRIEAVRSSMDDAQKAANNEEKSSAGDKYETSRAMNHLEKDMQARQLAENLKELANLHTVDVGTIYSKGIAGAFIQCEDVSFFVVAGLGRQIIESGTIYFLSPNAPLARILQDKKVGDSFLFNTVQRNILDLY